MLRKFKTSNKKANKVLIRMVGGLGNQMFCYAFYKKMSMEYDNVKFVLDISDVWNKQYKRKVELLDVFPQIKIDCATSYEIFKAENKLTFKYRGKGSRYLNMLVIRINSIIVPFKRKYCITEEVFSNPDVMLNWGQIRYFDGYWQNIEMYLPYLEELRRDFSFSTLKSKVDRNLIKRITNEYSVSVHIRRGDYVGETLDILNTDYYRNLITNILYQNKKAHFYIFSNDIPYVQNEYQWLQRKTIIEGNTGKDSYLDMQLMSLCKVNIIANSTFSIWAALLNTTQGRVVYYPSHYYRGIKMQDIDVPGFVKVNCCTDI